jgi:hypothetical protein
MAITPRDLLALGAADALVVDVAAVASHLVDVSVSPDKTRFAARHRRWSSPLPGSL